MRVPSTNQSILQPPHFGREGDFHRVGVSIIAGKGTLSFAFRQAALKTGARAEFRHYFIPRRLSVQR